MAGRMSQYLANSLLDHALGGAAYTPAATVYFAIFTTIPSATDSGAVEPASGSYARPSATNNSGLWAAAASRAKTTVAIATFATPTGAWGSAVGVGIYDAVSAGNLLWSWSLQFPITIQTGNAVSFMIGDLNVSISSTAA